MKSWFEHIWNDEDAFKAAIRAFGKLVVVILGGFVANGNIPTDRYGKIIGTVLVAIGAAFPTVPLTKVNSAPALNQLSAKLENVAANVKKVASATDVSLVINGDKKY